MNCYRCGSLMVQAQPIRFYACSTDMSEQVHGISYRCPICGNIEDRRIVRNRQAALLSR